MVDLSSIPGSVDVIKYITRPETFDNSNGHSHATVVRLCTRQSFDFDGVYGASAEPRADVVPMGYSIRPSSTALSNARNLCFLALRWSEGNRDPFVPGPLLQDRASYIG